MILAVYQQDRYVLTVTGHALAGEPGRDLVCASVSALVNTLALNVGYMAEAGLAEAPVIVLQEGNACVACTPTEGNAAAVSVVFAVIWHGLAKLAADYPENISFRLRGAGVEIRDSDFVNS